MQLQCLFRLQHTLQHSIVQLQGDVRLRLTHCNTHNAVQSALVTFYKISAVCKSKILLAGERLYRLLTRVQYVSYDSVSEDFPSTAFGGGVLTSDLDWDSVVCLEMIMVERRTETQFTCRCWLFIRWYCALLHNFKHGDCVNCCNTGYQLQHWLLVCRTLLQGVKDA